MFLYIWLYCVFCVVYVMHQFYHILSDLINKFWHKYVLTVLQVKEGKRLKEFLEDYDDDRDDPKYYRSVLQQKRKPHFCFYKG